ncbi:MAG: hypothetical protein AAB414_05475 [Patescibacteria group bacterium]
MNFLEVLAHGGEDNVIQAGPTLDQIIRSNSITYTLLAAGILVLILFGSLFLKNQSERLKFFLFISIVAVTLVNTIYLVGSTIYLNGESETGGPVHWHADFEIWNCGQEIELADPKGFSNRVGTSVTHEHNDNRIHIEGVVLENRQASLKHFFEEIGGSFNGTHLAIPTNEGILNLEDGNKCPDGKVGTLQVFVHKSLNGTFSQQKLIFPEKYIISPHGNVPPGDCIIFEFGPPKDKTDKLCTFYEVAIQKGDLREQ